MKPYTVLLLYPDFLGEERVQTYLTTAAGDSAEAAQLAAQTELWNTQRDATDEHDNSEPADYEVLMVIEGDHSDLKT